MFERVEQVGQQDDDLGVHRRVVGADRLRPDLPELAVAARLGRLVAEEARQVPQLHRLGQLVHAVLDVGAAHRRRALGAQGHGAPALVLEGEHLLAHDVRGLPHAAREQLGGLERGRLDAPVAGGLQHLPGLALDHLARVRVVGQHVERAARRLDAFAHWDASSRRNGFVARSCAERRQAHVPREDLGLRREGVEQLLDRGGERRPVAARQVGAPDRALEEHVAGEQARLVGDRVGDVAGAVAGDEVHVDVEAGEREPLAALDGLVGVVALERAEPGPGDVAHDVGEHRNLDLGAVDGRARRLGHRSHGADVVEVGVREQDRLDGEPQLLDRGEDPLRLVAGIDDQRPVGAVAAEHEAVLGHHADGEHADVHG